MTTSNAALPVFVEATVSEHAVFNLREQLSQMADRTPAVGAAPGRAFRERANIALSFCCEIRTPLRIEFCELGRGELRGRRRDRPRTNEEREAEEWSEQAESFINKIIDGEPIAAGLAEKLATLARQPLTMFPNTARADVSTLENTGQTTRPDVNPAVEIAAVLDAADEPRAQVARSAAPATVTAPPVERLTISAGQAVLDEIKYPVTDKQELVLSALLEARGRFIAGHTTGAKRADRVVQRLPEKLLAIIESDTGKGMRLTIFDSAADPLRT